MLIWTTKGPKRAEKTVAKQPSEEAFAESDAVKAAEQEDTKPEPGADVFIDNTATARDTKAEAADDGDWSSAETPRTKTPETAE